MANVRLGWSNPLTNVLQGEDAPNLRLLFTSLSHWLQFPLIGLHNTAFNVGTGAVVDVAWANALYDEYQLHAASAATYRAPPAFTTSFAIGAVVLRFNDTGGTYRDLGWKKNGTVTNWVINSPTGALAVNVLTCPFFGMVKRGDTLGVFAQHDAGITISTSAEAWMIFLPMGAGQG